MINRRTLFGASGALASLLSTTLGSCTAAAKSEAYDVEPRGTLGRLERLPRLDLESHQDFLVGFRSWTQSDLRKAAHERFNALFDVEGIDPEEDVPIDEILEIVGADPVVMMSIRAWLSCQQLTWSTVQNEFHGNADAYLDEMEAADRIGPGTLELNPEMQIPEYTKHEIHIQPGGYVGDPFAGHINHYGVNAFYAGRNYQDEVQTAIAAKIIPPEDGRVRRILDMGSGTGRLTFAMKERFPDAEVWGIDVGGPMVRYAHLRGVDLGLDCHFAQRLAEDNKFPDNHFDLVVSYIMFHEVNDEALEQIVAETYRVLRPGGVFFPIDFRTGKQAPKSTAYRTFAWWWDHHYNNEVWRPDFLAQDFGDRIARVGFDVDETIESVRRGHGGILATKPA